MKDFINNIVVPLVFFLPLIVGAWFFGIEEGEERVRKQAIANSHAGYCLNTKTGKIEFRWEAKSTAYGWPMFNWISQDEADMKGGTE